MDELEILIAGAAAVSFDFFDTLVLRPIADPEDAFDILGLMFGITDFRPRRHAAQVKAFERMRHAGRKEITLADIYHCMDDTGIASHVLMQAEYDLELELVEPNPPMFDLLRRVVASGKPVVIASDMYLPAQFFADALEPHGLRDVPIYISCERNATKRDAGELFTLVVQDLGVAPAAILHVGDNLVSDVTRAREQGLAAYHYLPETRGADSARPGRLMSSLAVGLLNTRARDIPAGSYTELGFLYGGPAAVGFVHWIEEQAIQDGVDMILFLSRDGYALEQLAVTLEGSHLPPSCYFLGSRTAFTLAAMTEANFNDFIPFLLSGSDGLATCELLERIGVPAPDDGVMEQLGLGKGVVIRAALQDKIADFLHAYRHEILKVCRRNRAALYQYLKQTGLRGGSKVALVDVGWNGTSQEAFELAARPLIDLDIYGYYFCLADTPERARRQERQRMQAMVNIGNTSSPTMAAIYANRAVVELFFSAPHPSIIGLEARQDRIVAIEDPGRGATGHLSPIAQEINAGIAAFARHFYPLRRRLGISLGPVQAAAPLIDLVTDADWRRRPLLGCVKNFDAWGSSRNHEITLSDYVS
ncbi:MAG TPA: HAD family hydrolase [Candidimonas sp.]|nr:HAD family hydrolase [Candidimonas sp.]